MPMFPFIKSNCHYMMCIHQYIYHVKPSKYRLNKTLYHVDVTLYEADLSLYGVHPSIDYAKPSLYRFNNKNIIPMWPYVYSRYVNIRCAFIKISSATMRKLTSLYPFIAPSLLHCTVPSPKSMFMRRGTKKVNSEQCSSRSTSTSAWSGRGKKKGQ